MFGPPNCVNITGISAHDVLELSIEDCKNLQKFLFEIGWIGYEHEHHRFMHELSHRIGNFLKYQDELAKRSSETT